jgi:hypothetical protein
MILRRAMLRVPGLLLLLLVNLLLVHLLLVLLLLAILLLVILLLATLLLAILLMVLLKLVLLQPVEVTARRALRIIRSRTRLGNSCLETRRHVPMRLMWVVINQA